MQNNPNNYIINEIMNNAASLPLKGQIMLLNIARDINKNKIMDIDLSKYINNHEE